MHTFVMAGATNGSTAPRGDGRFVRVTRYEGGWDISVAIGDVGAPRARAVAELSVEQARELWLVLGEQVAAADAVRAEWHRARGSLAA